MNGHKLARDIIAKHGVDRYPDVNTSLLKVTEELGELVQAVLKHRSHDVAGEYGDVGIALHLLGDKLGLDLGECMKTVVENETRRFD